MGRLIYVSALKETTDKTLFAAHLATFLKETHSSALLDGTPQTHILENFIAKRYHFGLKNNISLPVPDYSEFKKEKVQNYIKKYDFIITDDPKLQSLKEAEKLFIIASFNEAINLTSSQSSFLSAVWEIKKKRASEGLSSFRSVLILNQKTNEENYKKLTENSKFTGLEIAPYILSSDDLKKSLQNGITVMDKNISLPHFEMTENDFFARRDLKKLLEYLWMQT